MRDDVTDDPSIIELVVDRLSLQCGGLEVGGRARGLSGFYHARRLVSAQSEEQTECFNGYFCGKLISFSSSRPGSNVPSLLQQTESRSQSEGALPLPSAPNPLLASLAQAAALQKAPLFPPF